MLTLLFALSMTATPADGSIPPIDALIRGLEDSEKNLANFSVISRIETLDLPWEGPDVGKISAGKTTRTVETFTVSSLGQGRFSREVVDDKGKVLKVEVEVFDSRESRGLSGDGKRFERGTIAAGSGARSWQLSPWDYTVRFGDYFVSVLIKEQGVEDYRATEWEGRPAVLVVLKPIAANKTLKNAFIVDVERGFAVVKKSSLVETKPGTGWFEFRKIECRDHVEAAPNIWVPRAVSSEIYQPVSTNPVPVLRTRKKIVNEGWQVNIATSDSTNNLSIPNGVFVEDKIKGTTYIAAAINDQALVDSVSQARDLHPAIRARPGFGGRWLVGLAIGLTATIGAFVCFLLWSQRRRPLLNGE